MGTILAPTPPARGPACPACDAHNANLAQCELKTLSASQVGSFGSLAITLVFLLHEILTPLNRRYDEFFMGLFITIFVLTLMYYFVSEWVLEERRFYDLRMLTSTRHPKLAKALPYIEFYLRVLNALVLGLAASIPATISARLAEIGLDLDPIGCGLAFMVILYNLFLLWDMIVQEGGQPDVIKGYFFGDLVGAILTLICFWAYPQHPYWAAFSTAGLLILVTVETCLQRSDLANFFVRLCHRESLR
jgi:hypothetical protein